MSPFFCFKKNHMSSKCLFAGVFSSTSSQHTVFPQLMKHLQLYIFRWSRRDLMRLIWWEAAILWPSLADALGFSTWYKCAPTCQALQTNTEETYDPNQQFYTTRSCNTHPGDMTECIWCQKSKTIHLGMKLCIRPLSLKISWHADIMGTVLLKKGELFPCF